MTILIADDSALIRERLAFILEKIPQVQIVGQSATVTETCQAIRDLAPDLVTLDLRMPDGSGLDVLRIMRREHWKSVAIVVTNLDYPQYRIRALDDGAHAFFDKSCEFLKVADWVREWLSHDCQPSTGPGDTVPEEVSPCSD